MKADIATENPPNNAKSPTANMRRVDQVSGILWSALGILILFLSSDLTFIDEFGPSAGFLPTWLGGIMIFLGVTLSVKVTFFDKEEELLSFFSNRALIRMCLVIIGLFVYVFLFERAGFFLSGGLLFFLLLFFAEKHDWKFSLAISICSGVALYLIFEVALKVQLPLGFFRDIFYLL